MIELLTLEESCHVLSVDVHRFRRYVRPGLRGVRIGRTVYFPRSEIERWILQLSFECKDGEYPRLAPSQRLAGGISELPPVPAYLRVWAGEH